MSAPGEPAAGDRGAGEVVGDRPERWPVLGSVRRFTGRVVGVRTDTVRMPDGAGVPRDVVEHPGSVGVIAVDEVGRVLVVRQYRHPAGHLLWEPPAGLRDVPDEPLWRTAERELFEEAHQRAAKWRVLVDVLTSPGMSDESIRIFLARELSPVPDGERYVGEHEEADMPVRWVPVGDLLERILAGRLRNQVLVAGVLALHAAVTTSGLDALRPADAPFPAAPVTTALPGAHPLFHRE